MDIQGIGREGVDLDVSGCRWQAVVNVTVSFRFHKMRGIV